MRFPRQSEASAGGREWRRWVGAHTAGTNWLSARVYCTQSWIFCWHALSLSHTHAYAGAHIHTHTRVETANITQTFAHTLCQFGLIYRLHGVKLKVIKESMLVLILFDEVTTIQWFTQSLSKMRYCMLDIERHRLVWAGLFFLFSYEWICPRANVNMTASSIC